MTGASSPWRTMSALTGLILGGVFHLSSSCVFDGTATVPCPGTTLRCPTGWRCAAGQDICIPDLCGDGVIDFTAGEECDDGNIRDGDGCDGQCRLELCGSGTLEGGEVCDDGNRVSGDGCSSDCLSNETCGNGYTDRVSGEQCDGGEGCQDCRFISCGNGFVEAGEVCDDTGESTACNDDCTVAMCLDGKLNRTANETCDDGVETATCDSDCSPVMCGDSLRNATAGEQCDEGGDDETCDRDCTIPQCGDQIFNRMATDVEECDPEAGEVVDALGNSSACTYACREHICGDGITNLFPRPEPFADEVEERCDDGGEVGNNCRACKLDICNNIDSPDCCGNGDNGGVIDPWEACDLGLPVAGDGILQNGEEGSPCSSDCRITTCGDEVLERHEYCDGPMSADCDVDCTRPECGDGIVNPLAGEACDSGGTNNAFCTDQCVLVTCGDGTKSVLEQCDDGNTDDNDGCSRLCRLELTP